MREAAGCRLTCVSVVCEHCVQPSVACAQHSIVLHAAPTASHSHYPSHSYAAGPVRPAWLTSGRGGLIRRALHNRERHRHQHTCAFVCLAAFSHSVVPRATFAPVLLCSHSHSLSCSSCCRPCQPSLEHRSWVTHQRAPPSASPGQQRGASAQLLLPAPLLRAPLSATPPRAAPCLCARARLLSSPLHLAPWRRLPEEWLGAPMLPQSQ